MKSKQAEQDSWPLSHIKQARRKVSAEIRASARRGGRYAGALSSEGYDGGYRDALDDVILLLNYVVPRRRDFWE